MFAVGGGAPGGGRFEPLMEADIGGGLLGGGARLGGARLGT